MAHKQPTLVRVECQPPAVAEFDGALLHRHPPVRGRPRSRRCRDAIDLFQCSLWNWRNSGACAIHPGAHGAYRICALCLRREEKGKSDAPIEFTADLPRPRSCYGRACMWLGAVCRPARQDRGTDDADRRDHAGRRSKGSPRRSPQPRCRRPSPSRRCRQQDPIPGFLSLHPRPNRHLRLQRPRPQRQPPASAPGRWPVFAESSGSRRRDDDDDDDD